MTAVDRCYDLIFAPMGTSIHAESFPYRCEERRSQTRLISFRGCIWIRCIAVRTLKGKDSAVDTLPSSDNGPSHGVDRDSCGAKPRAKPVGPWWQIRYLPVIFRTRTSQDIEWRLDYRRASVVAAADLSPEGILSNRKQALPPWLGR